MKIIPRATYRFQFNGTWTFKKATRLIPYLESLGVSHCYTSPLLKSRAGSLHGYDTIDYGSLNPEIGTEADFKQFVEALQRHRMGLIIDIVPNHMCISDSGNLWWQDLLQNGKASQYADYFDIDWDASSQKIILPILSRPLNEAIAKREVTVLEEAGNYFIQVGERKIPTDPKSKHLAKDLNALLEAQHYRFCFWGDAYKEINYRRFFDILDLASLKSQNPKVFEATHSLVRKFIQKGWVEGLRIDHVDGLWNPREYLKKVRDELKPPYLIVEKILLGNETLRLDWPVEGTVGYEFLNQLNALYIYEPNHRSLIDIYSTFTGLEVAIDPLVFDCKTLILENYLKVEWTHLTKQIPCTALRDLIAAFPVYRTYATEKEIFQEDQEYMAQAFKKILSRHSKDELNALASSLNHNIDLLMRFQQTTGPAMAKGLEDTAYYRIFPLSSINEVGSDLKQFGKSIEAFHQCNLARLECWPHSMLSTSTHDTKRSEDVRARINILSEIPLEWSQAVLNWQRMNAPYKTNPAIPDANEEYLLYQTLLGSWPLEPFTKDYVHRIQTYMEKALKEAKIHSSWVDPNQNYQQAVNDFIRAILEPNHPFLSNFQMLSNRISSLGMLNSLSQLALKLTVPGIPDIYQGCELWNFSLVDPDNRREINFELREKLLEHLKNDQHAFRNSLLTPEDGRIKLLITETCLALRKHLPELFSEGRYVPLKVIGNMENHLVAFARIYKNQTLIVLAGRFFTTFMREFHTPLFHNPWDNTCVELPDQLSQGIYKDLLSKSVHIPIGTQLNLSQILKPLPIALMLAT